MKIEIPHGLAAAEAKARMKELGNYWQTKYGIRATWNGESGALAGSFMGVPFDATIEVRGDAVALEGPEPNRWIRTAVVDYLERKMSDYLDRKNSLRRLKARTAVRGETTR